MCCKFFLIIGIVLFLFFGICVQNAYAYLDPGTGTYLLQLLIAAVVGGLFLIKTYFMQIKSFFIRIFSKKR